MSSQQFWILILVILLLGGGGGFALRQPMFGYGIGSIILLLVFLKLLGFI